MSLLCFNVAETCHTSIGIYIYIYIRIYIYTRTCVCVCMYVCKYVSTKYVSMYIYICIYTCINAHAHTRRRLHSRVFCLLHSFAPNHHARACIALSWQILFGLWRYPAVVSPPFGNTNDFNVHCVCGARRSRRDYDIAAGWHSRPGFGMFPRTVQYQTNEIH